MDQLAFAQAQMVDDQFPHPRCGAVARNRKLQRLQNRARQILLGGGCGNANGNLMDVILLHAGGFDPEAAQPRIDLGRSGRLTFAVSLALVFVLCTWAMMTAIGGAIVASGTVAIQGKPKSVQHLDGGIVRDILVADGDRLSQGEVIMRLDDTLLAAKMEIYLGRLAEAYARTARLKAQAAGEESIRFPAPPSLLQGRDLSAVMTAERVLFAAHADILDGRRAQLADKIEQFGNQIDGVGALVTAKYEQLGYIEEDIERYRKLYDRQLVRESDMPSLQGSRADLLGQLAEHGSERARIENSVRDTELEMVLLVQEAREKAATELREVATSAAELTEQIVSTKKQLERVEIRAPVDGYVHDLQIVTIGGVVPPGGVIAQLVAHDGSMDFEIQVQPGSINQVCVDQDVRLQFPAFDQRSTPELNGKVRLISATTLVDKVTGVPYYLVTAHITPDELARLDGKELVPGMPVEAFLSTGSRSVASYLLKPLNDQFARAFREE